MRLLRVEGVNMRFVIEDTQDLRTISGGSQMLLMAVHGLHSAFSKLTPVSIGASSGVFEVLDAEPARIRDDVADYLRKEFPHATFVVSLVDSAAVPATSMPFVVANEMAIAESRWLQMSHPSLAFPGPGSLPSRGAEDHLRPAGEPGKPSASVAARRAHSKATFYEKFAGVTGIEPCTDLNQLSSDPSRGNLHNKIAVIYADGNSFARKIAEACKASSEPKAALRSIDASMRARRKELLATVVQAAERVGTDKRIRLETLLWGGDEVIWVVPAWRGWETLERLYQNTRWWVSGDPDQPLVTNASGTNGTPLHQAAGIVFCSRKSHIHRVVNLAKRLAEIAKQKDRERSLFAYQVLESFDVTGLDVEGFRRSLSPAAGIGAARTHASMVLDAAHMQGFRMAFEGYKDSDPPRGKVHRLARAILDRRGTSRSHLIEFERDAIAGFSSIDDLLDPLRTVDSTAAFDRSVPWLHINELWDYVGVGR